MPTITVGTNKVGIVLTRGDEQWVLTLEETDKLLTDIDSVAGEMAEVVCEK